MSAFPAREGDRIQQHSLPQPPSSQSSLTPILPLLTVGSAKAVSSWC